MQKRLAGKFFGHRLYYYPQTGSTNDEAYRLGMEGAPEGTAVIAETQTGGKGRLCRNWHSPAGSNIYTSLIMRPQIAAEAAPQISLAAGVAVADSLLPYLPGRVELKWPNDVLIGGKKVCGILAQLKLSGSAVDFVVLGIGINVNSEIAQFPEDFRHLATSLAAHACGKISRLDLIISLYENLAKWYKKLLQNGFPAVRERWRQLAPMIGRDVQVMFLNEKTTGKALDLADDGSLLVLTAKNEELRISAGDATIVK